MSNGFISSETIRDIKENICYVSMDFDNEKKGKYILTLVSNIKKPYELPDGQVINIGS
jgi:hypothetical protein